MPGRGEVARTHGEGREAARQRRARALGSTVALETEARVALGQFTNNEQARATGVAASEKKRYAQLGAEPSAQMLMANLARSVISLPMAQRAAESILASLRAEAGRSKRRRRIDQLQRWSSRVSTVSEPKMHPKGRRRQSDGMLRAQVQTDSGKGQLPDRNIRDHHSFKQQYVAYRAKERLAPKASEDEAWRRAWGQEQAIRRHETDRLRRSEQVKRRLIIEGLQPGQFRRIWLEGLKQRYRFKRARLKARQSDRWAITRSQWTASRAKVEPLDYKAWLRKCAATDPVAGRYLAWIDSMDARRAAAPATQGHEMDEQQLRPSEADAALPKTIDASEPVAQSVAESVSCSDMKWHPSSMSPGHFRLLAAAKLAKVAGAPTIRGMIVESQGSAESDALAHPAAVAIQHGIDGQSGNVVSRNFQDGAEAALIVSAAQGEIARAPVGASLQAGIAPEAYVEESEKGAGVEMSERDASTNHDTEQQGTEVAQSDSGLSIGEQAREVALWSHTRAARGGIIPGSMSESLRDENPEINQTPSRPATSTIVELAVGPPQDHHQTELFHELGEQGEATVPRAPAAAGPTELPVGAPGISEHNPRGPEAQRVPELLSPKGRDHVTDQAPGSALGKESSVPAPQPGTYLVTLVGGQTIGEQARELARWSQSLAEADEQNNRRIAEEAAHTRPEESLQCREELAEADVPQVAESVIVRFTHSENVEAAIAPIGQTMPSSSDPLLASADATPETTYPVTTYGAPLSVSSEAPVQQKVQEVDPFGSIRPLDPFYNTTGRLRSKSFQIAAATAIHAWKTQDWSLMVAATDLIAIILKKPIKVAEGAVLGLLKWSQVIPNQPQLPKPLMTPEECEKHGQMVIRDRERDKGPER